MKSSEKFRDTQKVPFKLDETRKPLVPKWEQKNKRISSVYNSIIPQFAPS